MIEAAICDGDRVVVRSQPDAAGGDREAMVEDRRWRLGDWVG